MGCSSKNHPDFVKNTFFRSVIVSMALGEFTEEEMALAYKDKTFNAGVNEVIESVKALRELTENIIEAKNK